MNNCIININLHHGNEAQKQPAVKWEFSSIHSPRGRGRGGGGGGILPAQGGTPRSGETQGSSGPGLGDPIQPLWSAPPVGEGSVLMSSGTQFPPT